MIASASPTNLSLNGESGWKLAMGIQSTDAVSTRALTIFSWIGSYQNSRVLHGWIFFLNLNFFKTISILPVRR